MKKIASLGILCVVLAGSLSTFAVQADARGPSDQSAKWPQHQQTDGRGSVEKPSIGPQQQASKHNNSQYDNVPHTQPADNFSWGGHDFRKGKTVPHNFQAEHYRVKDWRASGLYQPPRGQNWAYINGNYVLISAATGIVTAILLSSVRGH